MRVLITVSPQETAAQAFKVNLATREGLQAAVLDLQPHIVVNCAAVSQPAACERDYEACKALNVPKQLVTALQQLRHQHGHDALLIHISTDQVRSNTRLIAVLAGQMLACSIHVTIFRAFQSQWHFCFSSALHNCGLGS
eukprot:GHUV01011585.1.p1 GENE.GHUV01011585.1~~GHUV01011585.1.p1  ORF type:complete len:139 (+),score=13.24 GHUV01011585.1:80-496(+)